MKSFKDFGIKNTVSRFTGEKIKMRKVIDKQIIVHDFSIETSKYNSDTDKCLYMQIEINDTKHLLFSGSKFLIDAIKQVPKSDFSFTTTILEEGQLLMFS